jgi:hypothetical protein
VVVNPNGDKLVLSKWKLDPKTNKWKKVPRRWSGGHVMCHHYFGIERLIIQQLNLPTDDLVLIHDGFVINEKINFPETFKIESLNLTLDIKFSEAIL